MKTTETSESNGSGHALSESTERAQQRVERAREQITDTIEEIQTRLSPGQLVDEVASFVKGNGNDAMHGVARAIGAHPLPCVLIGTGVAWLALSSQGARESVGAKGAAPEGGRCDEAGADGHGPIGAAAQRLADAMTAAADRLDERGRRALDDARRAARELGEEAAARAGEATQRTGADLGRACEASARQLEAVTEEVSDAIRERPLAFGAAGVLLGAALGLVLAKSAGL